MEGRETGNGESNGERLKCGIQGQLKLRLIWRVVWKPGTIDTF